MITIDTLEFCDGLGSFTASIKRHQVLYGQSDVSISLIDFFMTI